MQIFLLDDLTLILDINIERVKISFPIERLCYLNGQIYNVFCITGIFNTKLYFL